MASKSLKDPTFPSILDLSDEELEKRYEWLEQQNERNLAIEEMAYEEDRWHDVHLDAPDGDEHDTCLYSGQKNLVEVMKEALKDKITLLGGK